MMPGVVHVAGSRIIAWIGLLAVLCACADSTATQPEPSTSDATTDRTTEPSLEPTGPESPQRTIKKESTELAGIPPGSTPGDDFRSDRSNPALHCVAVFWGGGPLPEGTVIKLGAPRLVYEGPGQRDPRSVFRLDRTACRKFRSCTGTRIGTNDTRMCFVGLRQVTKEAGLTVGLRIPGVATCATKADCRALERVDGGGPTFDSVALGTTEPTDPPETEPPETDPPSEPPSEPPGETPSDPASETPSGG
jgi:hypothetical protein